VEQITDKLLPLTAADALANSRDDFERLIGSFSKRESESTAGAPYDCG
jgi:hypothetical protein